MRVKFTADHNHTFKSRAVAFYPEGLEDTVTRDVGERAIRLGRAVRLDRATPVKDREQPDETLSGNLDPALAEPAALEPNLHVDGTADSK